MRLWDSVLISLSLVFFIIGVHQVMTVGIAYAYWLLMFSLIFLFWHNFRRRKRQEKQNKTSEPKHTNRNKHKKTPK